MRHFLFCVSLVALLAWRLEQPVRAQAPSAPTWAAARLGNVFEVNEPVELPLKVQADSVYWQVTDFWHNPVDLGSNVVADGKVTIKPKTSAVGTPAPIR
jgi:predicted kinase